MRSSGRFLSIPIAKTVTITIMSESTITNRTGAVKIATWLLLGQTLALLALGILNFLDLGIGIELTPEEALGIFFKGLTGSIIFITLACIALIATFSFWRMDSLAWTIGMLTQGLMLLAALIIFFEGIMDVYAYTMMAYGIFMVIYLHMPDIIGTLRQANKESV